MRFVVTGITLIATAGFIVASGLMNFTFMTSLGKSDLEQQIFGAVSIAVSAFIALLPTLILWAFRERRFVQAFVALPVFLAFVTFSLSSAVGFAAKNRGGLAEDRNTATVRLAEVRGDILEAVTKRNGLGKARPVAVVQEGLRGMEADVRFGSCQNAASAFCRGYYDTKGEAARAGELAVVEAKIEALKAKAREYEDRGAGREADSQSAVLAGMLGWDVLTVERGLTLFLAVLVELGAAVGFYLSTGHIGHGTVSKKETVGATVRENRTTDHFRDATKMVVSRSEIATPVKLLAAPVVKLRRVRLKTTE
jgi:hypothetical protein